MKKTDVKFLAGACNGLLLGNKKTVVCDVKIDSRETGPGCLFAAIKGEKNDGHKFWESCVNNGCRAFLFSEDAAADAALAVSHDSAVILVKDTEEALKEMASAYLNQFKLIKVGITGSVGKTTTRNLTAAVLSSKYKTIRNQKNLNTNLGLCLTCFQADDDTKAAVFEMGMDRKGEIAGDVEWIKPDAAIITNIGISHMERLGSRDAIADAKLEITRRLPKDAPLIVNAESDYLKPAEIKERAGGEYRIVTAARSDEYEASDVTISEIKERGAQGVNFALTDNRTGESAKFTLPLPGAHNALNAALASALGLEYGVSLYEAASALANVTAQDRRLNVETCGAVTLLDDSYNASPDSMKAGLSVLSLLACTGRRIAVLSDMLELGSADEEGHTDVGCFAAEKHIDFLVAIGAKKEYYSKGARSSRNGSTLVLEFDDIESAECVLFGLMQPGDAVLVKGSNSTGVSKIAQDIREKFN